MNLAMLTQLLSAGLAAASGIVSAVQSIQALQAKVAAEGRTDLTPDEVAAIRAQTDAMAAATSALLRGPAPG